MPTPQQRKEECRRAVRGYLADRSRLSMSADAITRGLRYEGGFDEEEVRNALTFLEARGHLKITPDADGATPYFQITGDGTLAHERAQ